MKSPREHYITLQWLFFHENPFESRVMSKSVILDCKKKNAQLVHKTINILSMKTLKSPKPSEVKSGVNMDL